MPEENQHVRVRFAPSPTGMLHVGGLRTALYNYLFARKHEGDFLLRIEDTDRDRYVAEAETDIVDSLEWVGFDYDEGPGAGGPHAPYRQSERVEMYQKYAAQLVEEDHAYYAFDTEEELEELRSDSKSRQYDASTRMEMTNSLTLSEEEVQQRIAAGEPYVVRLLVPRNDTVRFPDIIRDWVSFETAQIDDQVLLKSDGMPTYHLANVVDDHHMEISHVIRGEEWLSSTPKHVLLYRYLGWEMPEMAHLPLILSPAGGKLSKRSAEDEELLVYVREYREAGYEPEALVNFLAFLGWNPGDEREIFSLEELTDAFSLDRVGSSGVQFDAKKLRWYNEQYLREKDLAELLTEARPYLQEQGYEADDEYLLSVIDLMQDRISLVADLASDAAFFFEDPEAYDPDGVSKRWNEDSGQLVAEYADALAALDGSMTAEQAEDILRELADVHDVGAGRVIHPARLAVSGRHYGPSLFHMMEVLGKDTCVRRMRTAAEVLG